MILARILFFPFWVLKLIIGIAVSAVVYFFGLFGLIFGEYKIEAVVEAVNDVMKWAISYP